MSLSVHNCYLQQTSGDKTDYLEFWSSEGGLEVFNMSLMKKHEQIVNGDQFSGMGGLALGGALNESVVYIAEKKRPEKYLHYGKVSEMKLNGYS